ncbi:MAG: T9SS type A sorting domain-containing protein [candidate division WOR-3 bacterium]
MKKYFLFLFLPTLIWPIWDTKWLNPNRWGCAFTNYGIFGQDNQHPGAYWPRPLRNFYIYGAGFWFGCINNNDTLVTTGYEPNSAYSEIVPTLSFYWRDGYQNPLDKIYTYPDTWPPPRDRFPMAPINPVSERDFWCCFCDSDPVFHYPPDTARPIGIDCALTVYSFSDSLAQDFIFLKYEIFNYNQYPINNGYFGILIDADVGDYSDDFGGWFSRLQTGFIGDYDNHENPGSSWERGTPGVVAIRFLTANPPCSLSSFRLYSIENDPRNDPERYQLMTPGSTLDSLPGDMRLLLSLGPFHLLPESSITFYFALIGAKYGEENEPPQIRDTMDIVMASELAETIFYQRIGIEETYLKLASDFPYRIYPNPFSRKLFILSQSNEKIKVEIYNTEGKLVKRLSGQKNLFWEGRDERNRKLPSGIYILKIRSGRKEKWEKVLRMR